jgi:hypothetical protein
VIKGSTPVQVEAHEEEMRDARATLAMERARHERHLVEAHAAQGVQRPGAPSRSDDGREAGASLAAPQATQHLERLRAEVRTCGTPLPDDLIAHLSIAYTLDVHIYMFIYLYIYIYIYMYSMYT